MIVPIRFHGKGYDPISEAGRGGRVAAKGLDTRERILDEAVRLASRDGLEGLTIGGLAAALKLSKSGLFAHFGSREALQVATLERAAERFQRRLAAGVDPNASGPERLRALLRCSMDWIDDPDLPGGCPILGACVEFDDREGAPREALLKLQRASQARSVALFASFAAAGRDTEQLAFELRAITLAYHHSARVLRDPRARAFAIQALESLLERAQRPA